MDLSYNKWFYSIFLTILFLLLSSSFSYSITDKLFKNTLYRKCPTLFGIVIHSIILLFLIRITIIKNFMEGNQARTAAKAKAAKAKAKPKAKAKAKAAKAKAKAKAKAAKAKAKADAAAIASADKLFKEKIEQIEKKLEDVEKKINNVKKNSKIIVFDAEEAIKNEDIESAFAATKEANEAIDQANKAMNLANEVINEINQGINTINKAIDQANKTMNLADKENNIINEGIKIANDVEKDATQRVKKIKETAKNVINLLMDATKAGEVAEYNKELKDEMKSLSKKYYDEKISLNLSKINQYQTLFGGEDVLKRVKDWLEKYYGSITMMNVMKESENLKKLLTV